MPTQHSTRLQSLGLTESFLQENALEPGEELARVVAVNRQNCNLEIQSGSALGELTGKLRFGAASEMDLPAVGDWVSVRLSDDFALITGVLPRTSVLRRRRPGSEVDYQMVAANVDTAFVVHGCNVPVNPRRLERFAAMVRDGGVEAVVLLTKADLLDEDGRTLALEASRHIGETIMVNAVNSGGVADLLPHLQAGKTYAMLGPSGAGKTTLLNRLLGKEAFATQAVRETDGKGKHTTTRRHLVALPGGALLVDTPGMRELGMTDMKSGIGETFADIEEIAEKCRYRDCSHKEESGCAVQSAVESGQLDAAFLANYLKLGREAAHYERSTAERRKHDKKFGKLYKTIIQGKKDRR
jgi:ribosome biogenesis GTPase / thiamine phosphate phosphatase